MRSQTRTQPIRGNSTEDKHKTFPFFDELQTILTIPAYFMRL